MRCILIAILLATFLTSHAQEDDKRYKFKTTRYQIAYLDKYGAYQFSTGWKDTSMVIVINIKDKKLTFYSNPIKVFDIVTDAITYKDGVFSTAKWVTCLDPNSRQCSIRVAQINPDSEEKPKILYLYIDYLDATFMYEVSNEN